jgi:DNA helicase-2/ATP-dependent DNA helicase PcrA
MDDGTYNSFYGDDLILFLENFARVTGMPVSQVLANNKYDVDEYNAWRIIHAMYDYKKTHDLLDFTDMIQRFIDKDDPPRLEVLIIDEAQDLSNQQWLMVEILARHVKRLYIAGDDDQTIFTWAGASKKFISMPGKVILLKQSYRVPKVVHKLANRLIKQVLDRREKDWNPRDATGTFNRNIIDISEMDPAFVKSGSIMMLGRTVKLLKKRFVPYCKEHGLLYKYFDASSIKSAHATAIKGWQKLQRGESIPASDILKIYDLLPSESHVTVAGVKHGGKTQLNRIAEQPQPPRLSMSDLKKDYGLAADGDWSRVFTELDHRDVAYIKKVMQNGYDLTDTPQIHLSTIHRVKGGQADKVIMLSDMSKSSDRLNVSRDEETRVYYTGITRTYEDLVVLQPTTRTSYDEIFE